MCPVAISFQDKRHHQMAQATNNQKMNALQLQ
jgi:hypothetical protein